MVDVDDVTCSLCRHDVTHPLRRHNVIQPKKKTCERALRQLLQTLKPNVFECVDVFDALCVNGLCSYHDVGICMLMW